MSLNTSISVAGLDILTLYQAFLMFALRSPDASTNTYLTRPAVASGWSWEARPNSEERISRKSGISENE